jgi:hypothetical protein
MLAIAALAIVAVVLVGSDTVTTLWWLLIVAVVAPVALELLLARRGAAPAQPPITPVSAEATTPPPQHWAVPAPQPTADTPPAPAEWPPPAADQVVQTIAPAALALGVQIDVFQVQKSSVAPHQCEDAFAVDAAANRVAVSDGASSAFMSREWAQELVSGYVSDTPGLSLPAVRTWVEDRTQQWAIKQQTAAASTSGDDWWSDASAARGSFATLLGVQVDRTAEGLAWTSLAVGDSVLAQVRPTGDSVTLERSFPIEGADAFDGDPELVATLHASGTGALPSIRVAQGAIEPGDVLLLMTDALAQWALRLHQAAQPVWRYLATVEPGQLAAAVTSERSNGTIVDDDVTLLRLRFDGRDR